MTIPNLTRSKIQANTTGGSFERGEEYLEDGAVRSIKRADDQTVKAQVQGSDVHPYLVTIRFDAEDIQRVQCTCPYVEGSWCKHIAAVLLKVLDDDGVPADEAAAVADLLSDLDRSALVSLIEGLVQRNPDLVDHIERERDRLA